MRLWPRRGGARPAGPQPRAAALELSLEGERFAPGEVVRGSVIVADGTVDVRIAARFHERSVERDFVAVEVADAAPRRAELSDGVAYRFAIELPPDALPSCPSPHGGLGWTVDASAPALGPGAAVSRPIEVSVAAAVASGDEYADAQPSTPGAA